jgi:hypothetical protein
MTPEELDEARAKEARRIYGGGMPSLATIAARLAREGWTPSKPVDPDLLAVREIVAREWEQVGFRGDATKTRSGDNDDRWLVSFALAAYKAGKAAQ